MRSTPTPRVSDRLPPLAAAAAVLVALLLVSGGAARTASPPPLADGAAAWGGFADADRREVAVGQRVIVVLAYPSLADQVHEAGGQATELQMRRFNGVALAGQKQIAARLSREGVGVEPEYVYTRTFNGFAAALDERALALLERDEDVIGVYPVRAAYPVSTPRFGGDAYGADGGRRVAPAVPGVDGAGITVALLDTGVDFSHPYLRGRLRSGIDVLTPDGRALARAHPDDSQLLEQHATQLAGLLVGRNGPTRLQGVAPGATVLPIRVAGWQPNAHGGHSIFARTDQVLAGLEWAVDPDGDGSAFDAARVAVVGVAEPFAAFTEGPLARAVLGAQRLDTLVVAPAGNDGPAGPGYGNVGGPGGAPAALTVGAADARAQTAVARVVLRTGLRVVLDRVLPLAGDTMPAAMLSAPLVRPAEAAPNLGSSPLARFFDVDGFSTVAGRAALLGRAVEPAEAARRAAQAGASVVLLDGPVPAGALGRDERLTAPVVGLPPDVARTARQALARGIDVSVALGRVSWEENGSRSRVAPFSSRGLSFGGGVKPEVVAPGVELLTSDTGRNADRTPRYSTVSGASAAAAVVGGLAALTAQERPELDAAALKSVLVGTAMPLRDADPAAQGAGLADVSAAVVAEVAAQPAAVAFGVVDKAGWTSERLLRVSNVTNRRVTVRVDADVEGIAGVSVTAKPDRLVLAAGERRPVRLTARASFRPTGVGALIGSVRLFSTGGLQLRVPWAVALPVRNAALLGSVELSAKEFAASDRAPAVLTVRAGGVTTRDGRPQLQPVAQLDVELWRGQERLGLLARLRDVLPGSYAFGITGRGTRGGALARGPYTLRVVAWPFAGERQSKAVPFRIR